MREIGVNGIIICPLPREIYNEEILRLKLDRFPFVLIDHRLPGVDAPFVVGDGRGLTRQAVEHLVGLGHERIALAATSLRPDLTQSLAERMEGFQEAMKAQDLNPEDIWTVADEVADPEAQAWPLVQKNLASGVTAVIGTTTLDTTLIWRAAQEWQMNIPGDISVVGFDYSGVVDALLVDAPALMRQDALTWLDQSEETMARQAAELMLDVSRDPSLAPSAIVPGLFHQGRTTAPPRVSTDPGVISIGGHLP